MVCHSGKGVQQGGNLRFLGGLDLCDESKPYKSPKNLSNPDAQIARKNVPVLMVWSGGLHLRYVCDYLMSRWCCQPIPEYCYRMVEKPTMVYDGSKSFEMFNTAMLNKGNPPMLNDGWAWFVDYSNQQKPTVVQSAVVRCFMIQVKMETELARSSQISCGHMISGQSWFSARKFISFTTIVRTDLGRLTPGVPPMLMLSPWKVIGFRRLRVPIIGNTHHWSHLVSPLSQSQLSSTNNHEQLPWITCWMIPLSLWYEHTNLYHLKIIIYYMINLLSIYIYIW